MNNRLVATGHYVPTLLALGIARSGTRLRYPFWSSRTLVNLLALAQSRGTYRPCSP